MQFSARPYRNGRAFLFGGDFIKRLYSILKAYRNNEKYFTRIYEGPVSIVQGSSRWSDNSAVYFDGEVGYEYTRTNRSSLDKPTVTIMIPADILFNGDENMKRLKYYFLKMDEKTSTYTYTENSINGGNPKKKSMYDGEMIAVFQPKSNGELLDPEVENNPTFWSDDVSYRLDITNKLSLGKPTVTIAIPSETLDMELPESSRVRGAVADALLREFNRYIEPLNAELNNRSRPDNENGHYYVYEPGGEVLVRNSAYFAVLPVKDYENGSGVTVYILPQEQLKPPRLCFCVRMQVQLPAMKLRKTQRMLCSDLPGAVSDFIEHFDRGRVMRAAELSLKQAEIRSSLRGSDYCVFIANGSILPREGDTSLPMTSAAPFKSTPEDEIEVAGVCGMGIKRGVTLITGGGYSGKSTLLNAISAGIYDHCEGDGRELVISDDTAVDITAEDGRSVKNVNISPFIKWLPGDSGDTQNFSTAHASGSTSQAANILEAVDIGSRLLLIDEDRSATNFMIRDERMKRLIEKEPITPFTDRVQELNSELGVSTILVIGGSGEYLPVADRIYMMDDYVIRDATERARIISPSASTDKPLYADWKLLRGIYGGFSSYPGERGSERLEFSETGFIIIGGEFIDTKYLHNLATSSQANAIGFILRELMVEVDTYGFNFTGRLDQLYKRIDTEGLDCVFSSFFTGCPRFLDLPRMIEVTMALDRMRGVIRRSL